MDSRELYELWRTGDDQSRIIKISSDISFNVILPTRYWEIFDLLEECGLDMPGVINTAWLDSQDREVGPMWVNDYETFRRHLVAALLLYDDKSNAIIEGRHNDNQPHLAGSWLKRRQSDRDR